MEKPNCKCHDEPMYWNKAFRKPSGGSWRCSAKDRARNAAYRKANCEKELARAAAYYYERGGRDKQSIRITAKTIAKYQHLLEALERGEPWLMEQLGLVHPTPTHRMSAGHS